MIANHSNEEIMALMKLAEDGANADDQFWDGAYQTLRWLYHAAELPTDMGDDPRFTPAQVQAAMSPASGRDNWFRRYSELTRLAGAGDVASARELNEMQRDRPVSLRSVRDAKSRDATDPDSTKVEENNNG